MEHPGVSGLTSAIRSVDEGDSAARDGQPLSFCQSVDVPHIFNRPQGRRRRLRHPTREVGTLNRSDAAGLAENQVNKPIELSSGQRGPLQGGPEDALLPQRARGNPGIDLVFDVLQARLL